MRLKKSGTAIGLGCCLALLLSAMPIEAGERLADKEFRAVAERRFTITDMVNQKPAGEFSSGPAARSSAGFGLRRAHKYLGYGTLILAGVAAFSGSESDLHCVSAHASAGAAAATCATGFMKYRRRWNPGRGLFNDDNSHIMLGVVGGIGMVVSVITADSDSGPGHAGVGAAGGALMAVSVILLKW